MEVRRVREGRDRAEARATSSLIVNESHPERVPRGAPDGVRRRHHRREAAVRRVELRRAGGERQLLLARRALRRALVEREHAPDVRQAHRCSSSWFNAGVRAVDIRDPYRPKEIGYYIPAITDEDRPSAASRRAAGQRCKIAIQTNNVEVDDRGYIYIVDRANTGMHILELTGAARRRWPTSGRSSSLEPCRAATCECATSDTIRSLKALTSSVSGREFLLWQRYVM